MTVTTTAAEFETIVQPRAAYRWARALLRFVRRKPMGAIGLIIAVVFVAVAAFAPLIATHEYDKQALRDRLKGPSATHYFGTDANGRDVYSRVVYGARVSVAVGFGSIIISLLLGTIFGGVSGYLGGKVDILAQRVVDIWIAFPSLLVVITIVAILGPSLRNVVIVIGINNAGFYTRVVRSAVIAIKELPYVEAARVLGATGTRVFLHHILPNAVPVFIVLATVQIGFAILTEATVSFLGYGVPPPEPSWGQLLSGQGAQFLDKAPWLAIFPGAAIALVVFGFNMLGDALRDVLDPRLRGST